MPTALERLTINGLTFMDEARIALDSESFSVKGVLQGPKLTGLGVRFRWFRWY